MFEIVGWLKFINFFNKKTVQKVPEISDYLLMRNFWIINVELCTFVEKIFGDIDSAALSRITRIFLECESQNGNFFIGNSIEERRYNSRGKTAALIVVHENN